MDPKNGTVVSFLGAGCCWWCYYYLLQYHRPGTEEAGNLETSMDTGRALIKLNLSTQGTRKVAMKHYRKLSDNNCSILAKATERHWPHLHPGQQRLGREPSGEPCPTSALTLGLAKRSWVLAAKRCADGARMQDSCGVEVTARTRTPPASSR